MDGALLFQGKNHQNPINYAQTDLGQIENNNHFDFIKLSILI